MKFQKHQLEELYDAKVETTSGDSLGGVKQVYVDDHTGEPAWVTVTTGFFGMNESFVPLSDADYIDGVIRVPYTKDQIKDSPNYDAEHHLSEADQDDLYRYYGLGQDRVVGDGNLGHDDGLGRDRAEYGREHADVDVDKKRREGVDRDVDVDRDRTDREGDLTLHEERVDVGTERVETGRVRLRKHVVTDTETVEVPVEREEVEIVREPVKGDAGDRELRDEEVDVTLHEERPVINKETVATERVGVEKRTVKDDQKVVTDVSHEELEIDESDRRKDV